MTTVTLAPTEKGGPRCLDASSYTNARNGTGTINVSGNTVYAGVGQASGAGYTVYQGCLTYDLSSIPSGVVVSDAHFSVRPNAYGADWATSTESIDFQFKSHGHPPTSADFITGNPLTSQDATLAASDAPSGFVFYDATSISVASKVSAAIGGTVDVVYTSHKQSTNTAPTGQEWMTPDTVNLVVTYYFPEVDLTISSGGSSSASSPIVSPVSMALPSAGGSTVSGQVVSIVRMALSATGSAEANGVVAGAPDLPIGAQGVAVVTIPVSTRVFLTTPASGVAAPSVRVATPVSYVMSSNGDSSTLMIIYTLSAREVGPEFAAGYLLSAKRFGGGFLT